MPPPLMGLPKVGWPTGLSTLTYGLPFWVPGSQLLLDQTIPSASDRDAARGIQVGLGVQQHQDPGGGGRGERGLVDLCCPHQREQPDPRQRGVAGQIGDRLCGHPPRRGEITAELPGAD
jgi:hypothetical protein